MNTTNETILFEEGMEHDLEEGWPKVTSRQQGGRPAKAFKELIQNALDSYPEAVPIKDRKGDIINGDRYIAIKDFGSGMSLDQINMLFTVGGTTKYGVNSLIGNFGIGFKQLFNERLGATLVKVTTVCENFSVELTFTVKDPKAVPDIDHKILDHDLDYGTMVEVFFNNDASADECLEEAVTSLRYYPCRFTINGAESISEWDKARQMNAFFFSKDGIEGYIQPTLRYNESRITALCKYEYISKYYISYFMAGATKPYDSLADYAYKDTPFIPGLHVVVNSNDLNVTISRDRFYCDNAFDKLVSVVNQALLEYLADYLTDITDWQIIMANIYSLKRKVAKYLNNPDDFDPKDPATRALRKLTRSQVFRVAERRELFSLQVIKNKRTPGWPLYYSSRQENVRWLGCRFKHDFVLTPYDFTLEGGLRDFYHEIFNSLFSDTIDLDRIQRDTSKLNDLVKRGIVDRESLSPAVEFADKMALTRQQKELQAEINKLLYSDKIREVLTESFDMKINHIRTAYFDVADGGMYISTGLFDSNGKPLSDLYMSNFIGSDNDEKAQKKKPQKRNILLGLNIRHPLIAYLCTCKDPNRAAYSLTYVVNQLAMCQRSLVPYSGFHQLNKAKLAKEMRSALLDQLTGNEDKHQDDTDLDDKDCTL